MHPAMSSMPQKSDNLRLGLNLDIRHSSFVIQHFLSIDVDGREMTNRRMSNFEGKLTHFDIGHSSFVIHHFPGPRAIWKKCRMLNFECRSLRKPHPGSPIVRSRSGHYPPDDALRRASLRHRTIVGQQASGRLRHPDHRSSPPSASLPFFHFRERLKSITQLEIVRVRP